jgi:hypothetical protein
MQIIFLKMGQAWGNPADMKFGRIMIIKCKLFSLKWGRHGEIQRICNLEE